jgi:hypothetical protein
MERADQQQHFIFAHSWEIVHESNPRKDKVILQEIIFV